MDFMRRGVGLVTGLIVLLLLLAGLAVVMQQAMKNFHLPLPEETYSQLRAEAERSRVPATSLAREAIDAWLRQQRRKARHDAIAAFAGAMAGSRLDLDPELESAGIEHLRKSGRVRK